MIKQIYGIIYSQKSKALVISAIFFIILLPGCGKFNMFSDFLEKLNGDSAEIAPVTLTSVSSDSTGITVNWTNPSEVDIEHIAITWDDGTTSGEDTTSAETYLIDVTEAGLIVGNTYTISLTVVDVNGNESDPSEFDFIYSASGSGHFIYTEADLAQIGVLAGWELSYTYYLMENLDLSGYPDWTPIGYGSTFTGKFYGRSHTISNLTITTDNDSKGLFSAVNGGIIQDLTLTNVSIAIPAAATDVGSLAGICISETISNVSASGIISHSLGEFVGGLVGAFSGTMDGCSSSVEVTGGEYTGGLIAQASSGTISNCRASGTVSGGNYTGGLMGSCQAAVENCYTTDTCDVSGAGSNIGGLIGYNTGALTGCHAAGSVTVNTTHADFIGGLVGNNAGIISTGTGPSYATGDVIVELTAMSGTSNIGGLIGITSAAVTDAYATGNLSITLTAAGATNYLNLGGLVGHFNVSVAISGLSASGAITVSMTGSSNTERLWIGGLIGINNGGGISDCHYSPTAGNYINIDCSTDTDILYAGGLIGYNPTALSTLTNSSSTGAIVCDDALSDVMIGGFVGLNYVAITTSFATGDVTGTTYAGGFVGNNATLTTITNCYSRGDVIGNNNTGGFAGYNAGSIQYSYSAGSVDTSGTNYGGLIGFQSGTWSSCFYESATGASIGTASGTPYTPANMIILSNFTASLWDSLIWNQDSLINDGYLYLLSNIPE